MISLARMPLLRSSGEWKKQIDPIQTITGITVLSELVSVLSLIMRLPVRTVIKKRKL